MGLLLVEVASPHPASADGAIVIQDGTLAVFKGFGFNTPPYDRQLPTYGNGSIAYDEATWLPPTGPVVGGNVLAAMRAFGATMARVYVSPTIGNSDNTLDPARLQDLLDDLTTLRSVGVVRYVLNVFSAPPYMKLPDHVRYGFYNGSNQYLDPAYAGGTGYQFADYYIAVLRAIKQAGFPRPEAVSIQNEPDVGGAIYDETVYGDNAADQQSWREVVKQLRQKLDSSGSNWFSKIVIVGPENSGWDDFSQELGTPSNTGFSAMSADPALTAAIGGFAYHSYFTSGHIEALDAAIGFYPGKERWMLEYSTSIGLLSQYQANSGVPELNWGLDFVRRMAGDFVDFKSNYWLFWRFWHSSSVADDQDLVYGDGQKTKAYYVYQRLFSLVHAGWKIKSTRTTDPDLRSSNAAAILADDGSSFQLPVDILAFRRPDGNETTLMIANAGAAPKTITALSGLTGAQARIFVTDPADDMAQQPSLAVTHGSLTGAGLVLPPYSITVVDTQ